MEKANSSWLILFCHIIQVFDVYTLWLLQEIHQDSYAKKHQNKQIHHKHLTLQADKISLKLSSTKSSPHPVDPPLREQGTWYAWRLLIFTLGFSHLSVSRMTSPGCCAWWQSPPLSFVGFIRGDFIFPRWRYEELFNRHKVTSLDIKTNHGNSYVGLDLRPWSPFGNNSRSMADSGWYTIHRGTTVSSSLFAAAYNI